MAKSKKFLSDQCEHSISSKAYEHEVSLEDNEGQGYQLNPMLLDTVLQVLFSYVDVGNLKQYRLVNHLWSTKAFYVLKEKSVIRLKSDESRTKYLISADNVQSLKFKGFSFEILNFHCNELDFMRYLNEINPKGVILDFYMNSYLAIKTFINFMNSQSRNIVKLTFRGEWVSLGGTNSLPTDEIMTDIPKIIPANTFPQLEDIRVVRRFPGGTEDEDPEQPEENSQELLVWPVWIDMIKKSPALKKLLLQDLPDKWWLDVAGTNILENVETLILPRVTSQVGNSIFRMGNLNLKELEMQFDPEVVPEILTSVAHSLEILKFKTPNESALSPVIFPIMKKLKLLNSGNSQLSFPSIIPTALPALEELQVTYWDWVWTFEQLPDDDDHYYWKTDDPHSEVNKMVIRFPPLSDIRGTYTLMENFRDFCNRLSEKFPALSIINFDNFWIRSLTREDACVCKITTVFGSGLGKTLREFAVSSYSNETPVGISPSSNLISTNYWECRELMSLDLNPTEWLKLWNGDPSGQTVFTDFQCNCAALVNLQILKLLWQHGLRLSELIIMFPRLKHLEVIGDKCIDRFDRYKMKQLSVEDLTFIQHPCKCPEEDVWFMSDPKSDKIFQNLFKCDRKHSGGTIMPCWI